MKTVDPEVQARLEAGALVLRDFVWLEARDRDTDVINGDGFWSDRGAISADVLDKRALGGVATRIYRGGDMVQIGEVPSAIGLAAQDVEIQLAQTSAAVERLFRLYDLRRAYVDIHRGIIDPETRRMPRPAVRRFVGFVDEVTVLTPAEGEEGRVSLTAVSHVQEMTRSSSAKRSDADQRRRHPDDSFYRHAATVGSWRVRWQSEQPGD